MFDITTDDLIAVYEQLKDRYPLELTNTFALNDGFDEDMPIICGKAGGRVFWLYEHGGIFVFSVEVPGKDYHDHCTRRMWRTPWQTSSGLLKAHNANKPPEGILPGAFLWFKLRFAVQTMPSPWGEGAPKGRMRGLH